MSVFPLTSWYLSLDHKKWHPYTWEVLLLTIQSHIYSIMQSKLQVASHLLIVVDFNIVISVDPYQNFHNIKFPLVSQTYIFLVISITLSQVQPIISSIFLIWLSMISSFFIKGECWHASQLLLGIPKHASQLLLGVPNHSLQGGEWWGKID